MRTSEQLEVLVERALQIEDPPAYESTSKVRVTGERLSEPIHWTGRQWAVTGHGIEARDGSYVIEGTRVWEDEADFGWVRHLDEKDWVDLPDFVEALRIARKRWPRPT